MIRRIFLVLALAALAACGKAPESGEDVTASLGRYQHMPGFYDLYWDEDGGRLILAIDAFSEPFIYQVSMARGVGSNDLGLDRGQLGSTRVVSFERSGPKILLIEENLDYRATSLDDAELAAVEESFATSVIWGFEALGEQDGTTYVDATAFFLRDSHRIGSRLAAASEGAFKPDASRSAIYLPNTQAFPDNSDVEAIVTFTGEATGPWLRTVSPDAEAFTVHLHHSLVRLPDDGYQPIALEPRSGFFGPGFLDYASAVGEPLQVQYTARHRLEKKDPSAEKSEAVEPIVYYVDRGTPEPIRTALVEGAGWWNQAFEAAGYENAFRVEVLPEDAHPMDVRYNMINWVHRSTRGWSYGMSVADPRTGEILKGNVSLGSLRVRQDYLIAEGLLAPYDDEEKPDVMMEMALARIRQLSAHEVGHTLGIQHNMAASTQGRASVMDYPHPLIEFDDDGNVDLDNAYDVGIGEWDKRVILYGYQDFPDDVDAAAARDRIMAETIEAGFAYVSDGDSRAVSNAHPLGNLWDNGADSIAELQHLLRVRSYALGRFSERNIRPGRPMATLEEVLVPMYLLHRFQLIAVGKLVGGHDFRYAMRGDGQPQSEPVPPARQRQAMTALLNTLSPAVLRLPENVLRLIPPRPPGNPKSRETFPTRTDKIFEPFGAAESAAALTLEVLLEPSRAARLIATHARNPASPGFAELVDGLLAETWLADPQRGLDGELQRTTNALTLEHLLSFVADKEVDPQARAIALDAVERLDQWLGERIDSEIVADWRAHYRFGRFRIAALRDDPASIRERAPVAVPPGEPIGGAAGAF